MPQIREDQSESSIIQSRKDPNRDFKRKRLIREAIEDDDLDNLIKLAPTLNDIKDLRFDYKMNTLQMVCHEESIKILRWLTAQVPFDDRRELAEYRDSHLGSQAIHLTATTGNLEIIRHLIEFY